MDGFGAAGFGVSAALCVSSVESVAGGCGACVFSAAGLASAVSPEPVVVAVCGARSAGEGLGFGAEVNAASASEGSHSSST